MLQASNKFRIAFIHALLVDSRIIFTENRWKMTKGEELRHIYIHTGSA